LEEAEENTFKGNVAKNGSAIVPLCKCKMLKHHGHFWIRINSR